MDRKRVAIEDGLLMDWEAMEQDLGPFWAGLLRPLVDSQRQVLADMDRQDERIRELEEKAAALRRRLLAFGIDPDTDESPG